MYRFFSPCSSFVKTPVVHATGYFPESRSPQCYLGYPSELTVFCQIWAIFYPLALPLQTDMDIGVWKEDFKQGCSSFSKGDFARAVEIFSEVRGHARLNLDRPALPASVELTSNSQVLDKLTDARPQDVIKVLDSRSSASIKISEFKSAKADAKQCIKLGPGDYRVRPVVVHVRYVCSSNTLSRAICVVQGSLHWNDDM